MIRKLSFILIVCLGFVSFCVGGDSLVSVIGKSVSDYQIVECGDECQVLQVGVSDIDNILSNLNIEIISENVCEDRVVIEGFSNKLDNYVVINNRKVNVQVAIWGDSCLIGYPLIKNSF